LADWHQELFSSPKLVQVGAHAATIGNVIKSNALFQRRTTADARALEVSGLNKKL